MRTACAPHSNASALTALESRDPSTATLDGERAVDRFDVGVVETEVGCAGVLLDVGDRRGFRDHERDRVAGEEREDDLARRGTVLVRDLVDRPRAGPVGPISAPERRVPDDRDPERTTEFHLVILDGAFAEMIEDLIARDRRASQSLARLRDVVAVEIAHPQRAD